MNMNAEERKIRHEEWRIKYDVEVASKKVEIQKLLDNEELLDDDGYPTEAALRIIELWHWDDQDGWFEFIGSLWHLKSWGWSEGDVPHGWDKDKIVYQYHLSTAGWSGNESIITAMQQNDMLWHFSWVQSRRGGHYIFERRED